jgi:hypothetical protein
MKKLLIPLFALILAGAGCSFGDSTDVKTETETPAPTAPAKTETKTETKTEVDTETKTETPTPALAPTPTESGVRTLTPATTDDTWKTYANASLGFSFLWPTKGRYAPEWEVIFLDDTALALRSCDHVQTEDGIQFCHHSTGMDLSNTEGIYEDGYSTKIKETIVSIEFKKKFFGGICDAGNSTSNTTCIPFDTAEYQKTLDGIVGTFKITE